VLGLFLGFVGSGQAGGTPMALPQAGATANRSAVVYLSDPDKIGGVAGKVINKRKVAKYFAGEGWPSG
jgi:hypothetical protein